MAIQMNYYHPTLGITIMNAYWRVNPRNGINGGKDEINYIIEVFKDANTARAKNSRPINRFTFSIKNPNISDGAPNFIRQAYKHAKSLPMFKGCLNV